MAKFKRAALAALFVALSGLTAPAQACDSNYPWLCKPVPPVEPPEAAEPAAKPLQINSKRRAAKAGRQADERATRKEKRTEKAEARRHLLRARKARAERAAEEARAEEIETEAVAMPRRRPRAAGARVVEAEPSSGFMAAWTERTGTPAETVHPVTTVATAGPALASAESRPAALSETTPATVEPPLAPVRLAAQNEVNEIDLAAGEPPAARSESSWLRNLFLAFGGLIAFGSAIRLFV
jgi:hypothetical protein